MRKGKKTKKIYDEGSCFIVPLPSGGLARGVIARANFKGTLFCYFFGPRLLESELKEIGVPTDSRDAIERLRCGDMGLRKGNWKTYGRVEPWRRDEWPFPKFVVTRDDSDFVEVVTRDDDTFEVRGIESCPKAELSASLSGYIEDSSAGYVFVENRLSRILG